MNVGSITGSMVQQQVQLTVLRKALDMAASQAQSIMRVVDGSGTGSIIDTRV